MRTQEGFGTAEMSESINEDKAALAAPNHVFAQVNRSFDDANPGAMILDATHIKMEDNEAIHEEAARIYQNN